MSKKADRFYVYILYRDLARLQPFYVGKGCDKRFAVSQKYDAKKPHATKNKIIKSCVEQYGFVPANKIAEGLTELQAFQLEIFWIAFYGRADQGRGGSLCNVNEGGRGASGRVVSQAERELKRKLFKGRKIEGAVLEALVLRNKSVVYDAEMCRSMSERAQKRVWTKEQRVAASAARKGCITTKVTRQKQSEAMRKHCAETPSRIEKLKLVHTGRKRSEETRKKISEKAKARAKTPEGRAHLIKITKEYPKRGLPKKRRQKCAITI